MSDEDEKLPNFDKEWIFHEPAKTEARFRELLPQARGSGDVGYLAELLTQLARTRGLQRDFEGAHALLDEAQGMLTDKLDRAWVRLHLERGRTVRSGGDPKASYDHFVKAYVRAQIAGEEYFAVDAVHMLAIVATPDLGVTWNELAIHLAEVSSDPRARKWLGSLYNNTGWSYHDGGRLEAAMAVWQKALAWHTEHGSDRTRRIAKWTVARCLRSMGKYQEALDAQKALLEEYEAAGVEEAGYGAEEIAENIWALDRQDEARPWFARAHKALSADAWMAANEADRLARLKRLAEGADS